ncbi:serpin family protein [Nocardia sp. NPDC052001]|uniref:serpin family protein n=1 Tax=Nocardia sp. NPDC052001 TaxID=3154853 RepID=UPI003436E538
MPTQLAAHVHAANRLTARWCERAGTDDFVLSGCGVWPLLALLAATADEPARSELAAAAGVSPETAHAQALAMLKTLTHADSISAALGVWVRHDVRLRDEWLRALPPGTADVLGGQAQLDEWASKYTDGLIERFPLRIDTNTLLVLATALVARTRWHSAFTEIRMEITEGPWRGYAATGLDRSTRGGRDASVLETPRPVTRVVVEGTGDLDVHLLLGDGTPGEVLRAGLDAVDGTVPARTGLPVGTDAPGLTVREIESTSRSDIERILLPPFTVRSMHDLFEQPGLFGLTTALNDDSGHFPGMSDTPLAIQAGAQDVYAKFGATGFEAAAVTAFSIQPGGMPPRDRFTIRYTEVTFDRPFGFLAVHRPTGAAVVAGWVARPPV